MLNYQRVSSCVLSSTLVWPVVEPTPLKNMSWSGMMKYPRYGKIENVPNHQPVILDYIDYYEMWVWASSLPIWIIFMCYFIWVMIMCMRIDIARRIDGWIMVYHSGPIWGVWEIPRIEASWENQHNVWEIFQHPTFDGRRMNSLCMYAMYCDVMWCDVM